MFFGWDCVSCDDSAIATIRSALQALIHRQVANLWPLSTRGCASRSPVRGQRLLMIDLIVDGWRGFQGLELMNLHLMSYPTMQQSIFFQRFRCVLD